MANDKHKRHVPAPKPAHVELKSEPVAVVDSVVVEPTPVPASVSPEEATHVSVMTRGQARYHRVGRFFTPDVVELEIAKTWPDVVERADALRSLVSESQPGGCLNVEFFVREGA